ncbi:MAG: GNAT family N-acetyltransferase [Clostridia bacterium]|nr:GNAT family N-acetyltransferase [Clostridia bacterium]
MDNYADERDYKLLKNDKYTFFVLRRIIDNPCELLLSDHEKLILCYSGNPYPVWIWTPDDSSAEEMDRAYSLAQENGLFDGKRNFIVKYQLAERFMETASHEGRSIAITKNMFAYDCPNPIKPSITADGRIHRCVPGDIEELTEFISMFSEETGVDRNSEEEYRREAENYVEEGYFYLWKNEQGYSVAGCKFTPNGDMASVNRVFTRPEYRRKHYAENLVYQVTVIAKEAGYIPMLYTDADYVASNACYEKIGYVLRGKLCSIG